MSQPEAFSRVLIDRALSESGWNLLDEKQVRFELHGASGRADYVLYGQYGPLCVLEAKRENFDPYDAKEQTRGYAETLKAPRRHPIQRALPLVLELPTSRPSVSGGVWVRRIIGRINHRRSDRSERTFTFLEITSL